MGNNKIGVRSVRTERQSNMISRFGREINPIFKQYVCRSVDCSECKKPNLNEAVEICGKVTLCLECAAKIAECAVVKKDHTFLITTTNTSIYLIYADSFDRARVILNDHVAGNDTDEQVAMTCLLDLDIFGKLIELSGACTNIICLSKARYDQNGKLLPEFEEERKSLLNSK
jgi:hypothetical protein